MCRDETLYRYVHSDKTHLSSPAMKGLSDFIVMVSLTAWVYFLIVPTVLLVVNVHKPHYMYSCK
jgi:hypothetical protein